MAMVQEQQIATEGRPCYRHPKEMTLLACGRCEQPICTRCVQMSAAGPRCPDCARTNVKVSARGVAHDMSLGVRRMFRASPYVLFLLVMVFFAFFRGCACSRPVPPPPVYEQERPLPPESA